MFTVTDFPDLPTPRQRRRRRRGPALLTAAALLAGGAVVTATQAGAVETVWDRVAMCESGGNWKINTGNGYYGGLQFSPTTWKAFGGGQYAAYAHQASRAQQILIAQKVLAVQGPGAWPVCSKRAGLTRANGAAVIGGRQTQTLASRSTTRTAIVAPAGQLAVDGIRGPRTNMALEQWVGGSVNGSLNSADVRLLQARVGAPSDGVLGPITTMALQRRIGAVVDGVWGSETTRRLQAYLNSVL